MADRQSNVPGDVKSVRLLDIKGNIKKELYEVPNKLDLNNYTVSRNKRYICLTTFTGQGRKNKQFMYESNINGINGSLLKTIKQRNPVMYVSINGDYIVGCNDIYINTPTEIYTEKGLIGKITKTGLTWRIDFSNDGSWFAVTIQSISKELLKGAKTAEEKDMAYKTDLVVVNCLGKELWRVNDIARGTASDCCPVRIEHEEVQV